MTASCLAPQVLYVASIVLSSFLIASSSFLTLRSIQSKSCGVGSDSEEFEESEELDESDILDSAFLTAELFLLAERP